MKEKKPNRWFDLASGILVPVVIIALVMLYLRYWPD